MGSVKKTSPAKMMIKTQSAPQQRNDHDPSTVDSLVRTTNLNLIETSSFLGPRSSNQAMVSDDDEEPMSPININEWNTIYLTLKPAFLESKAKRKAAEKADKVFNDRLTQLIQLSNVTDVEALLKRLNN